MSARKTSALTGRMNHSHQVSHVESNPSHTHTHSRVTNSDSMMTYVKQMVTILQGSAGIATFPTVPGPVNGVSLAEVLRGTFADVQAVGPKYPEAIVLPKPEPLPKPEETGPKYTRMIILD